MVIFQSIFWSYQFPYVKHVYKFYISNIEKKWIWVKQDQYIPQIWDGWEVEAIRLL